MVGWREIKKELIDELNITTLLVSLGGVGKRRVENSRALGFFFREGVALFETYPRSTKIYFFITC